MPAGRRYRTGLCWVHRRTNERCAPEHAEHVRWGGLTPNCGLYGSRLRPELAVSGFFSCRTARSGATCVKEGRGWCGRWRRSEGEGAAEKVEEDSGVAGMKAVMVRCVEAGEHYDGVGGGADHAGV
ncbi:phosphomethylpyrimidine synthase isoform X2 [Gracilaria domingensis]|nr:phosphomethylpyrimidine synthase isoform X2 [Gracilaria domingensis]